MHAQLWQAVYTTFIKRYSWILIKTHCAKDITKHFFTVGINRKSVDMFDLLTIFTSSINAVKSKLLRHRDNWARHTGILLPVSNLALQQYRHYVTIVDETTSQRHVTYMLPFGVIPWATIIIITIKLSYCWDGRKTLHKSNVCYRMRRTSVIGWSRNSQWRAWVSLVE